MPFGEKLGIRLLAVFPSRAGIEALGLHDSKQQQLHRSSKVGMELEYLLHLLGVGELSLWWTFGIFVPLIAIMVRMRKERDSIAREEGSVRDICGFQRDTKKILCGIKKLTFLLSLVEPDLDNLDACPASSE